MGYGVDLNTGGKISPSAITGSPRSVLMSSSRKILKNEIKLFLDLYETISRMNDVPVYFYPIV